MYNWDYMVNAVCAKLGISTDELVNIGMKDNLPVFANEAMNQICSAVRPNLKHLTVEVTTKEDNEGRTVKLPEIETVQSLFQDDFVAFSDAPTTFCRPDIMYYGRLIKSDGLYEDVGDEHLTYYGYNQLIFHVAGTYRIPYCARWFFFPSAIANNTNITAPLDVCDAIICYMASQCLKIDDELKASIYRNEYEMILARIEDTNFKEQRVMHIGGGW